MDTIKHLFIKEKNKLLVNKEKAVIIIVTTSIRIQLKRKMTTEMRIL